MLCVRLGLCDGPYVSSARTRVRCDLSQLFGLRVGARTASRYATLRGGDAPTGARSAPSLRFLGGAADVAESECARADCSVSSSGGELSACPFLKTVASQGGLAGDVPLSPCDPSSPCGGHWHVGSATALSGPELHLCLQHTLQYCNSGLSSVDAMAGGNDGEGYGDLGCADADVAAALAGFSPRIPAERASLATFEQCPRGGLRFGSGVVGWRERVRDVFRGVLTGIPRNAPCRFPPACNAAGCSEPSTASSGHAHAGARVVVSTSLRAWARHGSMPRVADRGAGAAVVVSVTPNDLAFQEKPVWFNAVDRGRWSHDAAFQLDHPDGSGCAGAPGSPGYRAAVGRWSLYSRRATGTLPRSSRLRSR